MSGNVRGPLRAEKNYDLRDLLWLAPATERNYGQYRRLRFMRQRPDAIGQRRVDKSRCYSIHSESLSCILQRCRLSET